MTTMPMIALGDVADINPRLDEILCDNTVISFVEMSALSAETGQVSAEDRTYGDVRNGFTSFRDGDVLVAKITPCFENGKIAHAKLPRMLGFGSTEFHVVRARPNHADARYLYHYLRQDSIRRAGEQSMTGSAGQKRVPTHFLTSLNLPLPPLPEQRRIAELLDCADELRAKRRATIAHLDTLTWSIFLEMFGDPVTNPMAWPLRLIGDVGDVITGNTPSRAIRTYFGTDIEWIKSDNINTPHYYVTRASEGLSATGRAVARVAPAGSVLVTCIAGSPDCIGNSAMTDRDVAFNQQINALIPNDGDAHFLYAQLRVGKQLIQSASTSSMKGMVSKSRFERISLIFPPFELQQLFANRVLVVESLKARYTASLTKLDALFDSLQHRAFRGEL
jgi:type I restriction enzyme S subunit